MDMILGAVTNYNYEQIEPWIVSLERTGFNGQVALICYNINKETVDKLFAKNVKIFAFDQDDKGNLIYPVNDRFNINVERFIHAWYFLKDLPDVSRVIMTDVRDVIFQSNPFDYPWTTDHPRFYVASENITYENEPWSQNNMLQAFGEVIYNEIKNNEIVCAGILGGDIDYFLSICLNVCLLCRGSAPFTPGGGGPDQAALNLTLNQAQYADVDQEFFTPNDSWAVHLGTTEQAIAAGSGDFGRAYGQNRSGPPIFARHAPISWNGDGIVLNQYNEQYSIVHQYNRIPELAKLIEAKYRD